MHEGARGFFLLVGAGHVYFCEGKGKYLSWVCASRDRIIFSTCLPAWKIFVEQVPRYTHMESVFCFVSISHGKLIFFMKTIYFCGATGMGNRI